MRRIGGVFLAAVLSLMLTAADGLADSGDLLVQAEVTAGCVLDNPALLATLDFGVVSEGTGPHTASGSFTFTCSNGTAYTVTIDGAPVPGVYSGAMELSSNAAVTMPFGVTYAPTSGTSDGNPTLVTVDGSLTVPAAQDPGMYELWLTFTVNP